MKPADRYRWIKAWFERPGTHPMETVDICNADFVHEYIEATGAAHRVRLWGAPACPQLAGDLRQMQKNFILVRNRTGIEGMGGMGFPTWVWSYRPRKPYVAP